MIRLIASDLDGTLLQNADTVHPDNLAALRAAMDKGVHFAVASGRDAAACSILMRAHGLEDAYIIGTNGCEIMERPFGAMLERHHLATEAAAEAARIMRAHGLWACLYTDHANIFEPQEMLDRQIKHFSGDLFMKRMREAGIEVAAGQEAMEKAVLTTPMKIFAVARPGQEAAFLAARDACARIPGVALTSSWRDNFEVMPEGIDKGSAVRSLAERLGIDRSEVLAFGDNENDLSMLTWAGYGCAMGNAEAAIREAVGLTTGHCHAGGVAQAIGRYVLGEV